MGSPWGEVLEIQGTRGGGFRGTGLEMFLYEWRAMGRGRREGREADSAGWEHPTESLGWSREFSQQVIEGANMEGTRRIKNMWNRIYKLPEGRLKECQNQQRCQDHHFWA